MVQCKSSKIIDYLNSLKIILFEIFQSISLIRQELHQFYYLHDRNHSRFKKIPENANASVLAAVRSAPAEIIHALEAAPLPLLFPFLYALHLHLSKSSRARWKRKV